MSNRLFGSTGQKKKREIDGFKNLKCTQRRTVFLKRVGSWWVNITAIVRNRGRLRTQHYEGRSNKQNVHKNTRLGVCVRTLGISTMFGLDVRARSPAVI